MFGPEVFAARREQLLREVSGPILLRGMGRRARNLPMNEVPFRQDSSFWYLTGCALPGASLWLDDDGATLFVAPPADDDDLWHGHVDTLDDLAQRYGVDVRPDAELAPKLSGARPRTLAIADHAVNTELAALTGLPHVFGASHGDDALVHALIQMRRTKSAAELEAMAEAGRLSADAHRFVMAATKPGGTERALTALFRAYLSARGCTLGYDTILTQRGEVLHNHDHSGVLEAGRLLLLDGGGELEGSGYGADITRTWPVSGTFTPRQRAAYDAVLAAQEASLAVCRAGVRYREVHDAACRVLAQFLLDEGILRDISVDDAVETGAHALFFPHGVGHLLGLDVHDLENFGDLPAYEPGAQRPEPFGTRYLRLDLPLEPNWVVTIEPGFYVVPAILGKKHLMDRFAKVVDLDAIAPWQGFGGIRIEDDVVVTDDHPRVLTDGVPKAPDAVCALVGSSTSLEGLLP
jgi:Xaa-Pro aminopeptidase